MKVTKTNGDVIACAYDAYSRRIGKTVTLSGQTSAGPITRHLYDGWNPVAEYTGNTLEKTYTWGMDLSGTMQGAGGVGGLLAVKAGSASYYPTYDGNGNVSEYLAAGGAVAAHYEYDPFGNDVSPEPPTGVTYVDFSHRFSTKPLDLETGLYYYGYRYYDPVTGRWPSRDPIEEQGGVNLYGFVGNRPVGAIDYLGKEAKGYWRDEDGNYHSSKCMIPIFIGHNNVVPQGMVRDDPSGCSSTGVVSCGNLSVNDDGSGTTDPARSTVPGAPYIPEGQALNGYDVEKYVKTTVEAAKKKAASICADKKRCCKWVTIVLHVWSNLAMTDETAGYAKRMAIECKTGNWHDL